ncbi:fructose-1-phosphate kinase/fructose-6-phosphate kinase [Arthrobacter crystallopoietes BAB-32]|uniref:Fructose-1-phosphate kinase/fructose-6-phosphate kinase n=1 Tax=Arthrobacter crystallopoietes BAB-32 TaxID=1246476 RepID=N1V361_9MICC|nr:PfkB family carbohydrate kinase [Arthrobacter crystallopoietes]EMY32678.1 fructose-1-phosphate kinase/fructose-6-phosphate kinase [Arthrobacter crystallopoietes BAB-32]
MGAVVIFAPSPVLTVTIEDLDGEQDIHIHAGGQGVWQARMLHALGASVTLCGVFSGETGRVARHLLRDEGIQVLSVEGQGSNGAYVHDRRGGERQVLAESSGHRLTRHELDELYGLVIQAGIDAGTAILSGPAIEGIVPDDAYRRLASDLGTAGCTVIADLAGPRLEAAVSGGVSVMKIADDELKDSGRAASEQATDLVDAMQQLAADGAGTVIVTRAHLPSLLLHEGDVSEIHMPSLESVDTHGAGDSLTAGVAAALAAGKPIHDAVILGTAAGALNVTRHGLGTGDADTIEQLTRLVKIMPFQGGGAEPAEQSSPDDLARRLGRK